MITDWLDGFLKCQISLQLIVKMFQYVIFKVYKKRYFVYWYKYKHTNNYIISWASMILESNCLHCEIKISDQWIFFLKRLVLY